MGHGLPSRFEWHRDRFAPDSRRVAAPPKSAESDVATAQIRKAKAGDVPIILTNESTNEVAVVEESPDGHLHVEVFAFGDAPIN